MELLDSRLEKRLSDISVDDWKIRIDISLKILRGLDYLHSLKIYHSDLKPDNILEKYNFDIVKLVDFGVSVISSHSTFVPNIGYTPHYMAPEQAFDKERLYSIKIENFKILRAKESLSMEKGNECSRLFKRYYSAMFIL